MRFKALATAVGIVSLLLFLPASQIVLANDSFQVVGGWTAWTTALFVGLFLIAPSIALYLVVLRLRRRRTRIRLALYGITIGSVLTLTWSQSYFYYVSKWLGEYFAESGARGVIFFLVAAAVFAIGWRFSDGIGTFMSYLSPAALATLWLLSALPTGDRPSNSVDGEIVRKPGPIFLIVLDGLALAPLLDPGGVKIDEARFPTFARMSRDWAWFYDATTNATATVLAQPMMLTGRLIESRASGTYTTSVAQSVLTVLRRSSDMHVFTFGQGLCFAGGDLCAESSSDDDALPTALALNKAVFAAWWEASVPAMLREIYPPLTNLESWRFDWNGPLGTGRDQRDAAYAALVKAQFGRFISSTRTTSLNSTFLMWSTLTHFPYVIDEHGNVRLPSQRAFAPGMTEAERTTTLDHYRAQVQYVDGLLGQWLDALIESGHYDASLVIVTADHGISYGGNNFELDEHVTQVPFFAKLPGIDAGRHDRDVQIIDVAPTVLEFAGAPSLNADGQSLLQPYRSRLKVVLKPNRIGAWVRTSTGTWIRYDSLLVVPRL